MHRAERLLEEAMAIDLDGLEALVQQAHECDIKSGDDPPERFPIPRQALRMLWVFRRNLEAVDIHAEVER